MTEKNLKFNMPGKVLQMFEEWSEDHIDVIRLVGNVELNGTPIFAPLPYGRWLLVGDQLVTLTYYPPFARGDEDDTSTHVILRSTKEITDEVRERCGKSCIIAGSMTYKDWTERYQDCSDDHLKTVKISKE